MQGYFEGEYENANNPLRYKTSFDCWKNGLSDAEKTICATESIATADIEMNKKYEKSITPEWKQKRNNCKKDVDCLWNFYVKSIKSEYEKTNQKTLNLYEYLGGLEEDELYYPTEFTLLNDYFLNNMEQLYVLKYLIRFLHPYLIHTIKIFQFPQKYLSHLLKYHYI